MEQQAKPFSEPVPEPLADPINEHVSDPLAEPIKEHVSEPVAEPIGIRRNIQNLNYQERKQYFWCLKMLGILPSFQAMRERYFWNLGTPGPENRKEECVEKCKEQCLKKCQDKTGDDKKKCEEECMKQCLKKCQPYNQTRPKNLHDQLIANHATSCEHVSFYFAHYHRHLMFHFEMRLNYADWALSLSLDEFKSKFKEVYDKSPELCQKILAEYKQIAPSEPGKKRKKVMAHYWNPTNYNNCDDLILPIELSDPKIFGYKHDDMDQLFNQIQGAYPHEVNAKNRFYRAPEYFQQQRANFQKFMKQELVFFDFAKYEDKYKLMVSGQRNPRSVEQKGQSLDLFVEDYVKMTSLRVDKLQQHPPASLRMTGYKNYQKFMKDGQRMNLHYQEQGEIMLNYGGRFGKDKKVYNLQYLKIDRQRQTDQTIHAKVTYNQMLPHYQLGFALFNKDFQSYTDFLEPITHKAIHNSHATMHNNMHFSMMDGNFSLTNLMFFPYHSWIDAELEMKMRMCNTKQQALKMQKHLDSYIYSQSTFDALINPQHLRSRRGDYPIVEWADPRYLMVIFPLQTYQEKVKKINQIKAKDPSAFQIHSGYNARKSIINEEGYLRTSRQLKELYADYIKDNIKNFKEYPEFASFDPNYDYLMFETTYDEQTDKLQDINFEMGGYLPHDEPNQDNDKLQRKVQIPKYLLDMKEQANFYEDALINKITKATNRKMSDKAMYFYRRIVEKNSMLLLTYSSTLFNFQYVFEAQLDKVKALLAKGNYTISDGFSKFLEQKYFTLFTLPVFGKAKRSTSCINCRNHKIKLVKIDREIYERYPLLWAFYNILLLPEDGVIYDSTQSEKKLANVQEHEQEQLFNAGSLLQFKKYCPNKFKFTFLQGAEEMIFNFRVSNQTKFSNFHLKLVVQSLDIEGSPVSRTIKEFDQEDLVAPLKGGQYFTYQLDFYKMAASGKEKDKFDGMFYGQVHGSVIIDQLKSQFQFNIKRYHDLIRFDVEIRKQKTVKVRIVDHDYHLKKAIYQSEIGLKDIIRQEQGLQGKYKGSSAAKQ